MNKWSDGVKSGAHRRQKKIENWKDRMNKIPECDNLEEQVPWQLDVSFFSMEAGRLWRVLKCIRLDGID